MSDFRLAALHVGSLHLHSSQSDSPALRQAVARELGGADPVPTGLPPSAVLLVRRLPDPYRGSLGSGGFRPPAVWERALREHLSDAHRRAARPDRRGRVPANAAAIVFTDPAELLACRLRGLAAGEPAPWWTARLPAELGGGPAASTRDPGALLTRGIRELPAVFQRLADWGAVTPVLRTLTEPEATRLLEDLVKEWSLPAALAGHRASSESVTEKHQVERTPLEGEPLASRPAGGPHEEVVEHGDDPWIGWLPPGVAAASLPPVQRALAGMAFGLVRSPARLRSPVLVERVAAWWRRVEVGEQRDPERSIRPPSNPRSASKSPDASRARLEVTERPRLPKDPSSRPVPSSDEVLVFADAVSRGTESRGGTSTGTASESATFEPPHPELFDPPAHESPAQPAKTGSGPTPDEEAPQTIPDLDPLPFLTRSSDAFVTAWGGVFYLIHLLEEQGLPGAAEDEWRLETLAGPWGTLDLVARGLLAHRFPEIADDPVWGLLEILADWPDEGEGDGPDEVRHELSYPLPAGCPSHLARWLASALPSLRDRLLLALGEDAADDETSGETPDPIERLLAVPARLHVTSSHLDVVSGLDHIWLPARRAGLDRNPGWLPDYGRVVLLHFEELGAAPS